MPLDQGGPQLEGLDREPGGFSGHSLRYAIVHNL